MNYKKTIYLLLLALFFNCSNNAGTNNILVRNVKQFNEAVQKVKPGQSIVLANGIWNHAELLFEAHGTEAEPIKLTVEEKGKVILEGQSNLRIAGEHLIIEGLVFKNGYTPTNEVISFKKDKNTLSNHVRLTECVIDDFSNPERHEPDTWVAIYGKNNTIDHNHLAGKRNRGVTLTVRLNTEESQENFHVIEKNYFGPRQNLGSNGGETLRIGTSHYSRKNSNSMVRSNYFDRCNGEHEIISNKSAQNTYKDNVFYECTGTLTMRHGRETMIDGNIFIGNNKPSTGGIRVINGQQTVINNYGIGLKGYRFRGALVVMNGIYNSPINRYDQVEDAVIKNNTFINCDHIQLCAGSDTERSAPPINSVMEENIFYNENKNEIFTVYDDITGIAFKDNLISENVQPIGKNGFKKVKLELKENANGLLVPLDTDSIGAKLPVTMLQKSETGVSWYPKSNSNVELNSGSKLSVRAGLNTLYDAVVNSHPGDIIELASVDSVYINSKIIPVKHAISIVGLGNDKTQVAFEKNSLFEIQNGGKLSLSNLTIDGKECPDRVGNSVVTTSKYSMNKNYNLFVDNCNFKDLDVNHSFDVFKVYKNTFADTISIKNSSFKTVSGNIIALDKEIDDIGIYNAEYVILDNNSFKDIGGTVLRLHRGGKDESTFGPFLEMDHNVLDNVGFGKRNKYNAAVSLYGVQVIDIKDNILNNTKGVKMHLVVGEPVVNVTNNDFYQTDKIEITGDQEYNVSSNFFIDPVFIDENFSLRSESKLKGKSSSGQDIGLQFNK